MKRIFILIILTLISSMQSAAIPSKLEEIIKQNISFVYGENSTEDIYNKISQIASEAKKSRPSNLCVEDITRSSDWYKDEIIYILYPNSFGNKNSEGDFYQLIEMLDYLENLGITTIYILPFLDSPGLDDGFDTKNHFIVKRKLGGLIALEKFIEEAHGRGIKIKIDLVLNHISNTHQWFQSVLSGDLTKLSYFIYKEKLPNYKKITLENKGTIIQYYEDDGKVSNRRIIFPNKNGHHYRCEQIAGKDYYFYHTFHDFQPDINWMNPDVLYYMLDVISFWSNIGIDILSLDSAPFLIKKSGTDGENLPEAHAIIKIISAFTQSIAPQTVLQLESCQTISNTILYFGEQHKIDHKISLYDKSLIRTDGVQIAYNFPLMPALWKALLTKDNSYFWKIHPLLTKTPDSSTWSNFLRTHDDLTLEMLPSSIHQEIYSKLIKKGFDARNNSGINGRLASFLDNNQQKITLAYSILLSMPGIPSLYYGDEIGMNNNWQYAHKKALFRKQSNPSQQDYDLIDYFDGRDINRGPIDHTKLYNSQEDNQLFRNIKKMIKIRKQNPILSRGSIKKIDAGNSNILAFERSIDNKKIIVLHNLSETNEKIKIKLSANINKIHNLLTDFTMKTNQSQNNITLTMEPLESMWLQLSDSLPNNALKFSHASNFTGLYKINP